MSHYFDDILHRHLGAGVGAGALTPKSPLLSPAGTRLRRSSTSRSLAARSDFSANGDLLATNGTGAAAADDDDDGPDADPYSSQNPNPSLARRGSVNPATLNDPERERERQEAEAHLHSYITQQLERVRMERGADGYAEGDEFEAQV